MGGNRRAAAQARPAKATQERAICAKSSMPCDTWRVWQRLAHVARGARTVAKLPSVRLSEPCDVGCGHGFEAELRLRYHHFAVLRASPVTVGQHDSVISLIP